MLQAAQEPRTFYGLVARRALGLSPGFAWAAELSGEQEVAAVAEVAGGSEASLERRAAAGNVPAAEALRTLLGGSSRLTSALPVNFKLGASWGALSPLL